MPTGLSTSRNRHHARTSSVKPMRSRKLNYGLKPVDTCVVRWGAVRLKSHSTLKGSCAGITNGSSGSRERSRNRASDCADRPVNDGYGQASIAFGSRLEPAFSPAGHDALTCRLTLR